MADMESAVRAIYETVFDPDLWKDAALEVARLSGSSTFFLQTLDKDSGAVSVLSAHGLESLGIEAYERHFYKLDIWRDGLLAAASGKIHLYQEIVEQKNYENSEVFHDWVKPAVGYDIYWGMGGRFELLDGKRLAFCATHRGRNSDPLSRQEQKGYDLLLPHIQRALHLRQLFDRETSRARALEAVIDACTEALFLVDRDARLVYANRRALALLAAAEPALRVRRDGRLEAVAAADNLQLAKGVAAACSKELAAMPAKGWLLLSRASGRHLAAVVSPVVPARVASGDRCAVIAVRDVWSKRRADPAKIALVFGLTPAESRLVAKLSEGQSLRLAAEELGLTYNTVRTQLASALGKTGFGRQSDLMLSVCQLAEEAPEPAARVKR
ncbi:helix-turn-helix transcriptional regulator [Dongia sp. agr-C8]